MGKVARITNDKKLLLANELIEGDKFSLSADGTLHAKELIENPDYINSPEFRITDDYIMTSELNEGFEFYDYIDVLGFGPMKQLYGIIGEGNPSIGTEIINNIPEEYYPLYYDGWHEDVEFSGSSDSTRPAIRILYDKDGSANNHGFYYYNIGGGAVYHRLFEYDPSFADFRLHIGDSTTPYSKVKGEYIIRKGGPLGEIIYSCYYEGEIEGDWGCYLTTAMVGYFGKADDGIELTAMRELRKHSGYKYQQMLNEYYADSPKIITGIEQSGDKDYYYNMIKAAVDSVVSLVNQEEWEQAEQTYLDLYTALKDKFIGGSDSG